MLVPEFQWVLLGEKLSEGLLLYSSVEDHTAVLSGGVFWVMHELFGRSHIASQLIALFFTCIQAVSFNLLVNKNDLLKDHTYLPGIVYIIITSLYLDFYIVSPAMLGLTFALYGFSRFFQILKNGNTDDLSFKLGINIGIAFLFYKPFILLLFLLLFDLLLYSNTVFKRYIIIIFSFLFPCMIVMSYYYWQHALDDFMTLFFINSFSIPSTSFLNVSSLMTILCVPLLTTILGYISTLKGIGYINYQTKCHHVLFHWLILGTTGAFFVTEFSLFSFFTILPAMVLFTCAFFFDFKKKWLGEIVFICFIISILTINFSSNNEGWKSSGFINNTDLILKPHDVPPDGKLLVLDDDVSFYNKNKTATTFINWRINKEYFENLDDYNNISYIYEKLNADTPDIIIDPNNYCVKLFDFLPSIEKQYTKTGIMYFKKD